MQIVCMTVCEGLHCLSSKQTHNTSKQPSTAPYHAWERSKPFSNHSSGFHHQITDLRGIWFDTHHHRPRLLKSRPANTLQWNYWCRRGGQTIQRSSLPHCRPPAEDHLWQGPQIHCIIFQRAMQSARHPTESEHHLSPSNRWSMRENKSTCWDGLTNLL